MNIIIIRYNFFDSIMSYKIKFSLLKVYLHYTFIQLLNRDFLLFFRFKLITRQKNKIM